MCQESRELEFLACGGDHALCRACIDRIADVMGSDLCPLCRRQSRVIRTTGGATRRRLDFDFEEPEVMYGDDPVDPDVYRSSKIHCMLSFVISTCQCVRRRIPELEQTLTMVRTLCVPTTEHGLKFFVNNVPFANPNAEMILVHARFLLSNVRYADAVERNYLRYMVSQLDAVVAELH